MERRNTRQQARLERLENTEEEQANANPHIQYVIPSPSITHEGREDLFSVQRDGAEVFRDGVVESARFRITPLEGFIQGAGASSLIELHEVITAIFRSILQSFSNTCRDDDTIKIMVDQQTLDSPILIEPEELGSISLHSVMLQISAVLSSKRKLAIDDTFCVTISIIRKITGGVSKIRLLLEEQSEVLYAKRSMIRVRNQTDSACLPRAILLAWASRVRVENAEFNRLRHPGESMSAAMFRLRACSKYLFKAMTDVRRPASQDAGLKLLLQLAHLEHVTQFDLCHIDAIEDVLHCAIHVISQIAGNKFVRKPSSQVIERGWTSIFVYHHREDPEDLLAPFHYDAISKLPAFFGVRAVCETCLKPLSSVYVACCNEPCKKCRSKLCKPPSEADASPRMSIKCRTDFMSEECFLRHKLRPRGRRADATPVCLKRWSCGKCGKVYEYAKRSREDHLCGEYYCGSCEKYFTDRHECYVRVPRRGQLEKNRQDRLMVFFDIETRQTR